MREAGGFINRHVNRPLSNMLSRHGEFSTKESVSHTNTDLAEDDLRRCPIRAAVCMQMCVIRMQR